MKSQKGIGTSKMRIVKTIAVILALGAVALPVLSCTKSDSNTTSQTLTQTVRRGNISIDILGSGNLALSQKEDLAFEIAGYVAEITVEAGDAVKKGQVLATLDTSDWEDLLDTLQDKLTATRRTLTAKQRALTDKQRQVTEVELEVTTAERLVATKELAARQAKVRLQTAEYDLSVIADVKKAQDAVDKAENDLKIAEALLWERVNISQPTAAERDWWTLKVNEAKEILANAQQDLSYILSGTSLRITTPVALEVATKTLAVEEAHRQVDDAQVAIQNAQKGVEDAKQAVEDAKQDVVDAQNAVDDAQKAVENAQKALDKARSESPEVKAPFDGFITNVKVQGGDDVAKGTVAVTIADPAKFEAKIPVNETDIYKLKVGGNATIKVDALPQVTLLAKITHIAPTPVSQSAQSGVVNYEVTVEVESAQTQSTSTTGTAGATGRTWQGAGQGITQEQVLQRLDDAVKSGQMTEEQATQIRQRMQQAGQAGQSQNAAPAQQTGSDTGFEMSQLKEGLTVTVTITVQGKTNVLLVPNQAITRQGTNNTVQVMVNGVAQTRSIQTGIANSQYTEVTEGLSEGDQVTIPLSTAPATSTSGQPGGGAGGFIMRAPGR